MNTAENEDKIAPLALSEDEPDANIATTTDVQHT